MDRQKKKNVAADEYYPEFFDVFLPKVNTKRMRIPGYFVRYLRGRVLQRAILKSPKGRLWHVSVRNIKGEGMHFEKGWEQFTKDNSFEVGWFITFSFDGNNTFNFKIYKRNRCEKMETHEEEEKEEDGANDSAEESDSVEVVEDEYDEDDTDVEEEKDEQVKNRSGKKTERLRSCSRSKQIISIEDCGFEAEKYVQPDNPCFVSEVGVGNRRNELHIPSSVIRDFSLKLQDQQRITLRRCCKHLPKHEVEAHHYHHHQGGVVEQRQEIKGEVIQSKDGRFCIREWTKFCGRNRIANNDLCLCEFLVEGYGKTDTLQVHIVRSSMYDLV